MSSFLTSFWSFALPIIGYMAAAAAGIFITCFCIYRRATVKAFFHAVYRFVVRKPQYDYQNIFQTYGEQFNSVTDRRYLYGAILDFSAKILGAEGASILVKDSKGYFSVKASCGAKPFGFDVSEVGNFIAWLEKGRALVTRRYILNSKKCRDTKIEGLRYFVQFNAEACVPLFIDDKLYAILNLGARREGKYDRESRLLLSLMSMQFATAIHNANLHQALERKSAEIKHVQAFKGQLLMNLSHELRTPLNSIIGLSEMLAEGADGAVNSEQMTHLSMIRQSGKRLLDTVTAMLDLSKIESNSLELNIRHLSLSRLVNDAASHVSLPKEIKLVVDLKGETPSVYGDEERLREVIRHLLDNAAKFTKRGNITVEAAKTGEMLRVCVKDTGIGIKKEDRKVVFEGFRQGDQGHAREHEGLGLGLSISRKIVELHGGHLWFRSTQGKGSEFYFTLPLKPITVKHNEVSATQHV